MASDGRGSRLSVEEWERLPLTFGVHEMARIIGCGTRYANDHAEELGGRKVGGKWLFTKKGAAGLLGLDNE